MATELEPVLKCASVDGFSTATEQVMTWKYAISQRYYWVADEILEDFTSEFLSTPDDTKYMKNNILKLRRLAEYSVKDEGRARLLLTLLRKHDEEAFWELADGANGQEGNISYNTLRLYYVSLAREQCLFSVYPNSTGDHHLQSD